MNYTNEQIKAAYALNLCTVSVSQIVDYDDVNIMEQEYEAILNNLNLEQMPKDEALLKILKQILDTITFFRIQEGDKKFIEKEYQQKMKNAIWSAVPNIGLLVAGGNPITMAISLASQVGIGYMNYRRCKAEGEFEKEKELWQLERTAIEQFNGLRRELFDTAWRLAANYEFPDELRLTERQIKQYDDVLMDGDLIRKYERLDAIKDAFVAYPPFWYHFGNTANAIAGSKLPLSEETRIRFRDKAKAHFIQYRESNQNGLLREDPISSACALELIDLLDIESDKELVHELLDEALRYSGKENDVMQLAAMTYLKLGDQTKAADILKYLVNEQYNTTLNAQVLSSILVKQYIVDHSSEAKERYEILATRVGEQYLYPMPASYEIGKAELEDRFLSLQRKVLLDKYSYVIDRIEDQYKIRFGKIIPLSESERQYKDYEYLDTESFIEKRLNELRETFDDSEATKEYCYHLKNKGIQYCIIELMNDLYETVSDLEFVDNQLQERLYESVNRKLKEQNKKLLTSQKALSDRDFNYEHMRKLFEIKFSDFTDEFFEELQEGANSYVMSREELQDFAIAEDTLNLFCQRENLPLPVESISEPEALPVVVREYQTRPFTLESLGEEAVNANERIAKARDMMNLIKERLPRAIVDPAKYQVIFRGDVRIDRYYNGVSKLRNNPHHKTRVLAILDDTGASGGYDLLFTTYGVIPVKNNSVKRPIAYDDVQWDTDGRRRLMIDGQFGDEGINLSIIYDLMQALEKYADRPYGSKKKTKQEAPNLFDKLPFGKNNNQK